MSASDLLQHMVSGCLQQAIHNRTAQSPFPEGFRVYHVHLLLVKFTQAPEQIMSNRLLIAAGSHCMTGQITIRLSLIHISFVAAVRAFIRYIPNSCTSPRLI